MRLATVLPDWTRIRTIIIAYAPIMEMVRVQIRTLSLRKRHAGDGLNRGVSLGIGSHARQRSNVRQRASDFYFLRWVAAASAALGIGSQGDLVATGQGIVVVDCLKWCSSLPQRTLSPSQVASDVEPNEGNSRSLFRRTPVSPWGVSKHRSMGH